MKGVRWLLLAALALPFPAFAQTAPRGELRRDARLTAQDLTELRSAEPLPPGIDWKLTVGVAATDAESGKDRWATPFQLRALFNEGRTAFKLSGDGFSRERSIDGTASGLNDVNANPDARAGGRLSR